MKLPPPNVRFMNYESAIAYFADQVDEETIEQRRKEFDHMLRLAGLRGGSGQSASLRSEQERRPLQGEIQRYKDR